MEKTNEDSRCGQRKQQRGPRPPNSLDSVSISTFPFQSRSRDQIGTREEIESEQVVYPLLFDQSLSKPQQPPETPSRDYIPTTSGTKSIVSSAVSSTPSDQSSALGNTTSFFSFSPPSNSPGFPQSPSIGRSTRPKPFEVPGASYTDYSRFDFGIPKSFTSSPRGSEVGTYKRGQPIRFSIGSNPVMASPPENHDKQVLSSSQHASGPEIGVSSPIRSNLSQKQPARPVDLPFIQPKQVRSEHHRPVPISEAPSE